MKRIIVGFTLTAASLIGMFLGLASASPGVILIGFCSLPLATFVLGFTLARSGLRVSMDSDYS